MKGKRARFSSSIVGTQEIILKTKLSRNSVICRLFKDLKVNFQKISYKSYYLWGGAGEGKNCCFKISHAGPFDILQ